MKVLTLFVILAVMAAPAWSARKITVAELQDTLATMHKQNKSDQEVADALKQLDLTEELTRSMMNSMVDDVPGKLSTEQIYVLEARSADLAPPASDIPTAAAPDAAGQKAILDKAANYITTTYDSLPEMSATKTVLRFQDNVDAAAPSSGMHGSAQDASMTAGSVQPYQFVHYINATDVHVESDHGAELMPKEKDKTPWGANRMIALEAPDPSLGNIFREAQSFGNITWLRWEMVDGKQTAVFAFSVPKKKAHFTVSVCCFPEVQQAGIASFSSAATGSAHGSGGGGAKGNFQTNTSYDVHFKQDVPYHGELFINPDMGVVVRMITQAELKLSDVVHQEDTRIDYAPVTIAGKTMVVPVRTIVITEVVPTGDSGAAGRYAVRRTFFTSELKDYQTGAAK